MSFSARLVLASSAVMLAGLAPAPAQAADKELSERESREIGQKYGACVAAKRFLKQRAIDFVVKGLTKDGQQLSQYDCLQVAADGYFRSTSALTGKWDQSVFRKLVADGLVRTDFTTSGPTDFSAVPPLDPSFSMEKLAESKMPPELQMTLAIPHIAECATRKEPEAVRLLAQTSVGSPEERTALRALAPVFGGCLERAVAVNFSPSLLRDNAVLAYARLAYSLPAPAGQEASK